jgi:hypothetical protein
LMPCSHSDAKLGLGVCGNGWWVLSCYSFSPIRPHLEGYGTRGWYEMVREVQIKSRIHFMTLLNIQFSLCGPLEHDNKMFTPGDSNSDWIPNISLLHFENPCRWVMLCFLLIFGARNHFLFIVKLKILVLVEWSYRVLHYVDYWA